MSEHNPFTAVVDAQRRTIEQSNEFARRSVEAQKRGFEAMSGAFDTAERASDSARDVQETMTNAWLDVVENTAPGQEPAVEEFRKAVTQSFEAYDEVSDETWAAFARAVESQTENYDDATEQFLDVVEDATDASVETLDEWESTAEAVDIDVGE